MQWKTRPLGYFSYTVLCCLCKRGDLWPPASAGLSQISIHAPARGATPRTKSTTGDGTDFNSRPCERGDTCAPSLRERLHYFNSRPCERGDLELRTAQLKRRQFQFTPLREGRQYEGEGSTATGKISIHAPARGATSCRAILSNWIYFNSRPCERGDPNSICGRFRSNAFQFTPLREGRPSIRAKLYLSTLFQFTPLREGRQQN